MRIGYRKQYTAAKCFIPLLCIAISMMGLHLFLKRAEPSFVAQTSNYSNTAFTDLVNKCVLKAASSEEFKNFFTAFSSDDITAIEADTSKINRITSKLLIDIQNALNNDYPAKLYIPLGSLTDYYILSSMGPSIPVKIIPISVVDCVIDENFKSVGINQIQHTIDLIISVNMHYRGYLLDERETLKTTVPISKTIISGNVPEYYGNGFNYSTK